MKHLIRLVGVSAFIALISPMAASQNVRAQDQAPTSVTADQVNAIAKKLYCPVCENITLDNCGTAACADWRDEIRLQLETGRTEDEIIADFVQRFGDRVVGTPQDSLLRALSLITPWILIVGVLVIVGKMVIDRQRKRLTPVTSPPPPDEHSAQKYQDLLEQDLEG
jgi:cytochrome c-type biogenesis protein CcmH